MMTSMAITRINSMSVKAAHGSAQSGFVPVRARAASAREPSPALIGLPVGNVIVAAFPAVRAYGHQVIAAGIVPAGALVHISVSPWIHRHLPFEVWAFPIPGVTRLLDEVLEPISAFGVIAVIDFKIVQSRAENSDLGLGRRRPGLFGASGEFGDDHGGKDA
jgi:hypothetical protein